MNTKTRIVGSNFTTFVFNAQPIAWCDNVTDGGQRAGAANGPAYEAIYPLGYYHPAEFVTTRVLSEGSLTMRVRELWNAPAWQQLQGLAGTNNIVEIMQAVASSPTPISAQMIIKPAGSSTWRGWTYHNIVITDATQSETIALGTLSMAREVTAAYTHRTPLNTTATQIVY
jgi:hypothetical protein